jgi:hypothetical protein
VLQHPELARRHEHERAAQPHRAADGGELEDAAAEDGVRGQDSGGPDRPDEGHHLGAAVGPGDARHGPRVERCGRLVGVAAVGRHDHRQVAEAIQQPDDRGSGQVRDVGGHEHHVGTERAGEEQALGGRGADPHLAGAGDGGRQVAGVAPGIDHEQRDAPRGACRDAALARGGSREPDAAHGGDHSSARRCCGEDQNVNGD